MLRDVCAARRFAWNDHVEKTVPDITINRAKSLRSIRGLVKWIKAFVAPLVPWPSSVTCAGSPPNFSIFAWIHWSANRWSRSPKFPGAPAASVVSQPKMLVRDCIVTTTRPSDAKSKPVGRFRAQSNACSSPVMIASTGVFPYRSPVYCEMFVKIIFRNWTCYRYVPLATKRSGTNNSRSLRSGMDTHCSFLRRHSLRSDDILAESFERIASVSSRYGQVEAMNLNTLFGSSLISTKTYSES